MSNLQLHQSFSSNEEYNSSNCLSYSKIKNCYNNPQILFEDKIEEEDTEWLRFGSLVDILLTEPELFEKKVFVNGITPSAQYRSIIDYYVSIYESPRPIEELTDEEINSLYEQAESKVNWTANTKRQKLIDNGAEYFKILTEHRNKLIIDSETYLQAIKVVEAIKTAPWTKGLFLSKEAQEKAEIEIYYQFKIRYIIDGYMYKSKIDIVVIDHGFKSIQLFDIKTGSDTYMSFMKHAFFKYKYCYQAVLYNMGMEQFINKIPSLKDYFIETFRFVYINRTDDFLYPVVVEVPEEVHTAILNTGIDTELYCIPSLQHVFNAIKHYSTKRDLGEEIKAPYEVVYNDGEFSIELNDQIYVY